MKTWNIGNTTVRNPYRLREALQLFRTKMGGRPFKREEQQEFLNELVKAGLVDSDRAVEGDDGGRKFASAFKQLGFVTDWERGKSWEMTPVGTMLIEHPELEELIFLRQLMKYQIPSPLESGRRVEGFHVRPFRLLLRFLKRAREENLIGFTKFEIALNEIRLRDKLRDVREIQFYRNQCSAISLDEIKDLLEDIKTGTKAFFGGSDYAPAFLEWAIWRLFLAINEIVGPISRTRGFRIDEDINPIHHAKGGEADLTFTYDNFKLVCEMTLTSGSRQFAAEGEPVTRHVFKAIETSDGKPVYGLFIAKKLDPNTIDAFHKARYWKNYTSFVSTPVVALEIEQVLKLIERIKMQGVDATNFRELLDHILQLQDIHPHGPAWYKGYSKLYEQWVNTDR